MKDLSRKIHSNKTILTKEEFYKINETAANEMASNEPLQQKARDVLIEADKYRWVHQNSWLGEPVLNLPQDMFALQEIIWQTKPDYIIEVGVAWGGGLLFNATLLEITNGKKAIGVDIFIPEDLQQRLTKHSKLSNRLELINGPSTSKETIDKIKHIVGNNKKIIVILDSFHTEQHVLEELELYSPFVGEGFYLICGDTIIDKIPVQKHRTRPWHPGNNPATALKKFLAENRRFVVDDKIDQRLLISCHPGGYLKALE